MRHPPVFAVASRSWTGRLSCASPLSPHQPCHFSTYYSGSIKPDGSSLTPTFIEKTAMEGKSFTESWAELLSVYRGADKIELMGKRLRTAALSSQDH